MFAIAVTTFALAASALLPAWRTSTANPDRIMKASSASYVGTVRGKRRSRSVLTRHADSAIAHVARGGRPLRRESCERESRRLGSQPKFARDFQCVSPAKPLFARANRALVLEDSRSARSRAWNPRRRRGRRAHSLEHEPQSGGDSLRRGGPGGSRQRVLVNAIRPGLLSVLEMPLLSGRDFTDARYAGVSSRRDRQRVVLTPIRSRLSAKRRWEVRQVYVLGCADRDRGRRRGREVPRRQRADRTSVLRREHVVRGLAVQYAAGSFSTYGPIGQRILRYARSRASSLISTPAFPLAICVLEEILASARPGGAAAAPRQSPARNRRRGRAAPRTSSGPRLARRQLENRASAPA